MDENEENVTETPVQESPMEETPTTTPNPGVSFPTIPSGKPKSNVGKVILVVSLLAIVGVLGFFIFRGSQSSTPSPKPEATVETSTPTATPSVDKSKVKIEIQNGTGIPGEAAYLQDQLKSLGYSNITVGNATSSDNTSTSVTFAKDADQGVVDEITAKLKNIYKSVETSTSSSQTMDVLIVTGLRKGQTPKPVATATPKATALPSASPTATPTATP